jgi:hypothetical protein
VFTMETRVLNWLNPISWAKAGFEALAGVIGKTIVDYKSTEASRQDNQNKRGVDLAGLYTQAITENNRLKASTRTVYTVLFGLFMFATPVGIHWWAVMLDSIPFYLPYLMDVPHKIGSWKVAAPKGDFAVTYHKIIDSFFIAAPSIAGVQMLAQAFRR